MASSVDTADTYPKLLEVNAERLARRAAIREKEFGIWQTWTWAQMRDEVKALAEGFAALGMKRGDRLAIIGENRPQLYWGVAAAQAIGAVPVPMYQDSPAKELQFVIDHAEVRFALVEDQEQVDKLLEVRPETKKLEKIVYEDDRGMRNYTEKGLHDFKEVQKLGRELAAKKPDFYAQEMAKGKGEDVAIMAYTSGTTGNPKGVMLTFDNMLKAAKAGADWEGLRPDDEILAYLPLAWVGQSAFSIAQSYLVGFCVNCPESPNTVIQDLREIGPTYYFAPPRVFENLLTTVMVRMEDASWVKRKVFDYFMGVAKEVGLRLIDKKPVGPWDRFRYGVGRILVYGPLLNTLGFSRVRLAYTAGEAIGPDIFDFFRSLGMNLKQLYGQTECSVFLTIQPDGEVKPDTVGVAIEGVELKIDEATGEVLYRSPGVFKEYYKNPEATAETKTEDGWVHTGDAGIIDHDGHLKIIGRAKDVGRLNDGSVFAPKYLENKLKFSPWIRECVCFGHERDYVTAMISIDPESVGKWAERNAIGYGGYTELAAKREVYQLVREAVEEINRDLAEDEGLRDSQVKRFLLLHKELDADDGELTRTRKVRRRFVAERYAPVIEAFYGGKDRVAFETEVTFEDGRTGTMKADLEIWDAQTYGAEELKKAS